MAEQLDQKDVTAIVQARHKARQDRMKDLRSTGRVPMVRVVPTNPDYRKHLKHGTTGIGFPAEGAGEWPNDQFTQRRLREGALKLEEQEQADKDKKEQADKDKKEQKPASRQEPQS
jgi:hypothetical protein